MTEREILLSELLAGAGIGALEPTGTDPWIRGATIDSRDVRPGNLFFALPGFHVDGATFAADAARAGARAIVAGAPRPVGFDPDVAWVQVAEPRRAAGRLAREVHGRPDESLSLVGITGTNGKTTVAHLVESIGLAAGKRVGRLGTVGARFDGQDAPMVRTTPEATELYELLASMRDRGAELIALEVSSHALRLGRVEGARFAVAAFLNLTQDHLDFHGDLEEYFRAKASVFETLEADCVAVVPANNEYGRRIAETTRARVRTFGEAPGADVRLEQVHCGVTGSSAVLQTLAGPLPVRTRLPGRFNLDNIAAAAACTLELGIAPDAVTSGVLALERVPGRMEKIDGGQPFLVVVDYAHTEDALRNLLSTLRPLTRGRLFVVFGCGGERDRGKRRPMGRTAAELADVVFATSDNPRGEDPQAIVDEIVAGAREAGAAGSRLQTIVDRREAIEAALAAAGEGDVVAIAGKGHETTLTVGTRAEPFDDREVARLALERRKERTRRA